MQPGHIKLLLLIFLMLSVGGYAFYATNPRPATQQKVATKPQAINVVSPPAANVSNVHLDKQGANLTITGLAKDTIDPSLTSLRFSVKTDLAAVEGSFDRIIADMFVDKRTLKGGSVTIDMRSLVTPIKAVNETLRSVRVLNVEQFPQATFVITRIEKGQERGAIAVGDLTLHGVKKEIRIPFVREGGGLKGSVTLDLGSFGITNSGILGNDAQVMFALGVK